VTLRIEVVDWEHPAAVALRSAQRDEVAEVFGTPDSEPGPAPTALDVPVFLVAFDAAHGAAVGCGGLRPLDAHTAVGLAGFTESSTAEVKRMFVVPERRGTGVSTAIVRALEQAASDRGFTRLVLETGDGLHAAIRFYQREGFTPIPTYGHYIGSPISLCFSKNLSATAAS
jgi:putative acetyltransferase